MPIDEAQYLTTQLQICRMAGLVRTLPLDDFLAAINRAESFAPILHPTLYRAAGAKMEQVKRLAESLRAFRAEADRAVEQLAAAGEVAGV